MSCRVFHDKTLVTLNAFEYVGFLNGPFANVRPFFVGLGVFLLRVRGLPPGLPVVCELFDEIRFDVCGWLSRLSIYGSGLFIETGFRQQSEGSFTVKVGLSIADVVLVSPSVDEDSAASSLSCART